MHGVRFVIYSVELFAHLLRFDSEEGEHSLTVSFAGGHNHPH